MVNILYFGTNRQLLDIITHIPGRQVTAFETEIETINLIRSCAERKEHVVVMMDKTNGKSDSAIIAKIKATLRDAYIILISGEMTSEERKEYLKSGINDTMGNDVSMLVIDKKLQFLTLLQFKNGLFKIIHNFVLLFLLFHDHIIQKFLKKFPLTN